MAQHDSNTCQRVHDRSPFIIASIGLLVLGVLLLLTPAAQATTWSPQYPKAGGDESWLQDVSCTTSKACTAVGGLYHAKSEVVLGVVQRWDGLKWTSQTLPKPEGANWFGAEGISCPAVEICVAAGSYSINGTEESRPLAAIWNGSQWTLQSVPVPENTIRAALSDVSCVSTTECVAVGSYTKEKGFKAFQPYVVRWNGTKWKREIAGLPANGSGGGLRSVSCVSSSACTAVGYFYRLEIAEEKGKEIEVEVNERSLVDTWDGSQWSGSHLGDDELEDVSCPSAESCMAVGLDIGPEKAEATAWEFKKTSWSELEVPELEGGNNGFWGVSCTSATDCTAVGEYQDMEYPEAHLYVNAWNGTEWQLQTSIEPTEVPQGILEGVSCVEPTVCIAVGQLALEEEAVKALAEHSK